PWQALAEASLLSAGEDSVPSFLDSQALPTLDEPGARAALRLLEMARQARLSKTSCGWFFDDLGGIEPVQVLRHAARGLEIAREFGLAEDIARRFVETIGRARTHAGEDGASLLRARVLPEAGGAGHVAAFAAASRLARLPANLDPHPDLRASVLEEERPGSARLLLRVAVEDARTLERSEWTAAARKSGDGAILAGAVAFEAARHAGIRDSLRQRAEDPVGLSLAPAFSLPAPLGEAFASAPAPSPAVA
ncbi:MAG TPA: DUF3536 domain-containing protein, partial [Planctomycetota bacterium]|nr:DUF3536 domain-containing protein [Planctomycetota bacterium]